MLTNFLWIILNYLKVLQCISIVIEGLNSTKTTDLTHRRILRSGKWGCLTLPPAPWRVTIVWSTQQTWMSCTNFWTLQAKWSLHSPAGGSAAKRSCSSHQEIPKAEYLRIERTIRLQKDNLYKDPRSCVVRAIYPGEKQIPTEKLNSCVLLTLGAPKNN